MTRKPDTSEQEAHDALCFLCSMISGSATLTTKALRALLLRTGGRVLAAGGSWDIESKHLGAGVHRVSLGPRSQP